MVCRDKNYKIEREEVVLGKTQICRPFLVFCFIDVK
jgi:hypothetical protein